MIARVLGKFWRRKFPRDREFMGPFLGQYLLKHDWDIILRPHGIHHSSRLNANP